MSTIHRRFRLVIAALAATALALAQATPVDCERVARIYDLQKVLDRIGPGALPPVLGDHSGMLKPDPVAAQRPALQSLATLVRTHVRPELAANEEVRPLGERWLVVLGRAEQHAWIDRFLVRAHDEQPIVGQLRVDVVTMPEIPFLVDVAPALAQDGKPASEVSVLQPGAATTAFLAQLRAHKDVTAVPTPEAGAAMQAMVPCSLAAIAQTAYVRDFDVEVAQASVIANPIVDVIQEGFTLQATALPGKTGLGLALHAAWADLCKPIPTFTTTLGVGNPVTIQLPKVQQVQLEAAVELPPENVVVLLLPALLGKRCIAVVRIDPLVADKPKAIGR